MFFKTLTILIALSAFTQIYAYDLETIREDFRENVVLNSTKKAKKLKLSKNYFNKAKKHLLKNKNKFTYTQFVSLVDLSKQILLLTIWDNEKKDFFKVGYDYISSGAMEREVETKIGEDHYVKTPEGLFKIKSGWRSDGKMLDDNSTKPYGEKGRFVFYFGKHESIRYNTFDRDGNKIKDKKKWVLIKDHLQLAMHAHSSENTLGTPQSHGCLRISADLNKFLDNNFVFFSHLLEEDEWVHPYDKKPDNPKNHKLAGKYILIIDSVS